MTERDWLAERFESHRGHLGAIAYRMLGSTTDAEDAVQETWLRLARTDTGEVDNLAGWLTTVVSRVCLDVLRSRRARREQPVGFELPEPTASAGPGPAGPGSRDPEEEALVADFVGRALLMVLETLAPAERIAFVLHHTFAVPYAEIAPILGRSPGATKKLAGRARHRVQASTAGGGGLVRDRPVVDAFLAAIRAGDMDALLAVLDPDVVRRVDPVALPARGPTETRGARAVVREARIFAQRARDAQPALVNGALGAVVATDGQPTLVLTFTIRDEKITEFEIIADPARLRQLDLALLDG